jgi:L-ascorbate metabolism protein UlaG (beta-lactamase superfamily)
MAVTDTSSEQVPVRVFGGPTALIEYGGLRFLTDPTFDAPGTYASGLTKTAPASAAPADLGRIDVVLLSHDEHDDNLDASGRALLADVPLTRPVARAAWAAPPGPCRTGSPSS